MTSPHDVYLFIIFFSQAMPNSTDQENSLPGVEISYTHGSADGRYCLKNTRKINHIISYVRDKGFMHYSKLLKDFAHSASCSQKDCSAVCRMFRRFRRHITRPHPAVSSNSSAELKRCYMSTAYSLLLRQHVAICENLNCGLPSCPSLRLELLQRGLGKGTKRVTEQDEEEITQLRKKLQPFFS